jgi:hypothetical protein
MNLWLVFRTDAWHSNDSKKLAGVYDGKDAAIEAVDYVSPLSLEDRRLLQLVNQTQGQEENWLLEPVHLNDPINPLVFLGVS